MDAELTVGFLSFKESYTSKVTCRPNESVEVSIFRILPSRAHSSMRTGCSFVIYPTLQDAYHDLAFPACAHKVSPTSQQKRHLPLLIPSPI